MKNSLLELAMLGGLASMPIPHESRQQTVVQKCHSQKTLKNRAKEKARRKAKIKQR